MPPIHWHSFFFLVFAVLACGFAVAVVVASNVVRMAAYLVASLAAVAGLFFLAGADFIGAAQLMVYVGGTLVLLIFGVMLTAQGPLVSIRTGSGQWVMAILVGLSLLAVLLQTALSVPRWMKPEGPGTVAGKQNATTAGPIGLALLGVRVDRPDLGADLKNMTPADRTHLTDQSKSFAGYLLPFEIISVHLLVVLVGAAYLARAKRATRGGRDRAGQAPPLHVEH